MMTDFYKRIKTQQKMLFIVAALIFFMMVSTIASLSLLSLESVNFFYSIKEGVAYYALISIGLISALLLLVGVIRIWLRSPTSIAVAKMVEDKHPELMEALSSAVEIQEKSNSLTGPFEKALLGKVERDTGKLSFFAAIIPNKISPVVLLAGSVSLFALAIMLIFSVVIEKAIIYRGDLVAGEFTGIYVEPGDVELPTDSDFTVKARVMRWQMDPYIVSRQNGEIERYPMAVHAGKDSEFTIYGLTEDMDYRVETSSLQTRWFKVNVYDPPEIKEMNIHIEPPAYTGESPSDYDSLMNLFITEGSKMRFNVKVDPGVKSRLLLGEELIDLAGEVVISPPENIEYQFVLEDAEGREMRTPVYEIEVVKDEKPIVELVEPGKDVNIKTIGIIPVEIYAADDYGITRVEVNLSISGQEIKPLLIYKNKKGEDLLREESFSFSLGAKELGAVHSDVISYYITVWDNKEPISQVGKTELFFIEVLDDADQKDKNKTKGESGEKKEIDLRAVIIELKRLIRLSNEALYMEGDEREINRQEIGAGLSALHTEGLNLMDEFRTSLIMMGLGEAVTFIDSALERFLNAEKQINEYEIAKSLNSQAKAYSDLIMAESIIARNQSESGEGEGKGKGESSEKEPKEKSKKKTDPGSEDGGMSMSEMKEVLKDINKLVDEQSSVNMRYRRSEKMKSGSEEFDEMASMQAELEDETKKMDHRLLQSDGLEDIRAEISKSINEMQQAESSIRSGAAGKSTRSGSRAKEALLNASDLMSEKLQQAATGAVKSLSDAARQLTEDEHGAASASRKAESDGGNSKMSKAMRKSQKELAERYADILSEMDDVAMDLNDFYPEAGKELSKLARESESKDADKIMKRAVNALLYESFGRAAKFQDDAASLMEDVSRGLVDVMDELPSMTKDQMRNLVDRILEAREELATNQMEQMTKEAEGDLSGEQKSLLGEIGEKIGGAAKKLKNKDLSKLNEDLHSLDGGTSNTTLGYGEAGKYLDSAARVLQGLIDSNAPGDSRRKTRHTFQAPEKYQRLVEEYFKELAEEPQ